MFSAITGREPAFIALEGADATQLRAQLASPDASIWMAPDAATVKNPSDTGIALSTGWKLYLPGSQPTFAGQGVVRSLVPGRPNPAAWLLQSPVTARNTSDVFIFDPDNVMQIGLGSDPQDTTNFELYLPSAFVLRDLPSNPFDLGASTPPPPAPTALSGLEKGEPAQGRLAVQVQQTHEGKAVLQAPQMTEGDLMRIGGTLMTGELPQKQALPEEPPLPQAVASPSVRKLLAVDSESSSFGVKSASRLHGRNFWGTGKDDVVLVPKGLVYIDTGAGQDVTILQPGSIEMAPGNAHGMQDTVRTTEPFDHVVIDVLEIPQVGLQGSRYTTISVAIMLLSESEGHASELKTYVENTRKSVVQKNFWEGKPNAWGLRSVIQYNFRDDQEEQVAALEKLMGKKHAESKRETIVDDPVKIKEYIPGLGYNKDFADRFLGRSDETGTVLKFDRPDAGALEFHQRLEDELRQTNTGWGRYGALAAASAAVGGLVGAYVGIAKIGQAVTASKQALEASYVWLKDTISPRVAVISSDIELANQRDTSHSAPVR